MPKTKNMKAKFELERCTRCTLPITWETLFFDEDGVCNVCRNWKKKKYSINWGEREKLFINIVGEVKKKKLPYDCVVPFSGGKDSTFILWAAVRRYGMKPLVVSYDHCFYRQRTLENRVRTFRKLGVNVITFTPNWHIVKKTMREAFIRKGDFCWHCHSGVSAYPMQMAVKYKIPLVIYGEAGGEYEGYARYEELEENDEWKMNRRANLGIRPEDMAGFIGVDLMELEPYIYPPKEELRKLGIRGLHLGNFIPWDVRQHVEIIKRELGWQEDEMESGYPDQLTYEKIECMFTGIRDYIKYLKRGFSRITHLSTLDIRHGRMTREEAMKIIDEHEGKKPKSLEVFLEYLHMTEEEFHEIALSHLIPPAKAIDPKILPQGQKLWDQDSWYREKD